MDRLATNKWSIGISSRCQFYLKWVLDGEDVDIALVEEVVEDVDGVSGGGALSSILVSSFAY